MKNKKDRKTQVIKAVYQDPTPPITRKLRVLISSNAPWANSGYAQQARQFVPLIRKAGFATGFVAFYGLEGGIIELDGVVYFPKLGDIWGTDAMIEFSKHFNADVVISLQDIWNLNGDNLKTLANMGKRWIPINPVDHEPIPPAVTEKARMAYRIISMSPYGYREMKRIGLNSTYIQHTIEADIFKPYDKKTIRQGLNIPEDIFLFGMVSANKDHPPRKGFQHVLDAFKVFHDKHPKSGIYFHSYVGPPLGTFQIMEYAKLLGVDQNIYFTPPAKMVYDMSPDKVAMLYSAFDCALCPSTNGGFEIPIIEAQACQIPVICSDFTAMRDLVIDGVTGYKVKGGQKRFDPLGSYVLEVDYMELYETMEKVLNADREKMGIEGRKFVLENFEINKVWETKWLPFLNTLEKEVYPEN